MFLKHIDLTTALRPSYLPDEVLLFVQDNVGLYEGKEKLPNQQNGQVYLTSHRICYVDKAEPRRHSVALSLKDVGRYEFYAGFLKSSAKITLIPKPGKRPAPDSAHTQGQSPGRHGPAGPAARTDLSIRPPPEIAAANWICTICSFSNPLPANFDPHTANPHTPLPPCLTCGIKPTLAHVLKAAIASASKRQARASTLADRAPGSGSDVGRSPGLPAQGVASEGGGTNDRTRNECPSCTFHNHPSLLCCEMCSTPLLPVRDQQPPEVPSRSRSPAAQAGAAAAAAKGIEAFDCVKLSFRGGGDKTFYERLKGSMTQRKWVLRGAPPIPKNHLLAEATGGSPQGRDRDRVRTAGIAGLEQLGLNMRRNNEMIIGGAFEDLEALMASAKEVVELAERFARQTAGPNGTDSTEANALLAESASQLGLVTTKDIVGGSSSESLYVSELSRNLAEFLTDDARGILKKAGGIMSLVDLWAVFNRARGGVELVSPTDFGKAARMWEILRLPVRLREFKSGVLVVQGRDRTDETTVRTILGWLADLHEIPPERDVPWDWRRFGRGVTARDAAERFGWSVGVAEEELEMAEERGLLCREEGIEGLKFWENFILRDRVAGS